MTTYKWVTLVCLFFGPSIYFQTSADIAREDKINNHGKETDGYPTYIEKSGTRNSPNHYCDLHYQVDNNIKEHKKFPISSALYDQLDKNRIAQRESNFKIKYLPEDYRQFVIVGDSITNPIFSYLALIVMVVGLLGGGYWLIEFVASRMKQRDGLPESRHDV